MELGGPPLAAPDAASAKTARYFSTPRPAPPRGSPASQQLARGGGARGVSQGGGMGGPPPRGGRAEKPGGPQGGGPPPPKPAAPSGCRGNSRRSASGSAAPDRSKAVPPRCRTAPVP